MKRKYISIGIGVVVIVIFSILTNVVVGYLKRSKIYYYELYGNQDVKTYKFSVEYPFKYKEDNGVKIIKSENIYPKFYSDKYMLSIEGERQVFKGKSSEFEEHYFYTSYIANLTPLDNRNSKKQIDILEIIEDNYPDYYLAQYFSSLSFDATSAISLVELNGKLNITVNLVNIKEDTMLEKTVETPTIGKDDNKYRYELVYVLYIDVETEELLLDKPAMYRPNVSVRDDFEGYFYLLDDTEKDLGITISTNIREINTMGNSDLLYSGSTRKRQLKCETIYQDKYNYNCEELINAPLASKEYLTFEYERDYYLFQGKSYKEVFDYFCEKGSCVSFDGWKINAEFSKDGQEHELYSFEDYYEWLHPKYLK